jgi:hypothetical protein
MMRTKRHTAPAITMQIAISGQSAQPTGDDFFGQHGCVGRPSSATKPRISLK